ncbi:hypothetical protein [Azospirillum sp. INR13]|nr:hypothetical protein [Azospirillum sp. INR13]
MNNYQPISSWSLPSASEIKSIQDEAATMRAQFMRGLVRRLLSSRS